MLVGSPTFGRPDDLPLYPAAIVEPLQRIARDESPEACYLGDVN